MCDTLETTHEETEEVKWSRLNTISQEYEIFTHLSNHLVALGKVLTYSDLNLKVIRSLASLSNTKSNSTSFASPQTLLRDIMAPKCVQHENVRVKQVVGDMILLVFWGGQISKSIRMKRTEKSWMSGELIWKWGVVTFSFSKFCSGLGKF
ncbi:hypothetical protein Lal_00021176 [Lupinus albus]|nr:hypothetical protein Lal_00021176 [Lupinus albus]